MNPNYTEFKFPQIKAHPWTKVSKQVQVNCFTTSSTAALHLQPPARLHSIHIPVCTTQASPTAFHLVFIDTYFSTSWWKKDHFSLDCLYVDVFFLSSDVVVGQVTLQSVPNPSELSLVQKE